MAPSAEASVRFDSASRQAHSDQPIPIGGVPRALREAAEMGGLDPLPQLYNEALRYATEGHLRLARERLQMLLCMAPDDGEARLLLAKVYVAGQRWQDALAALDEAENCGSRVPLELREMVEGQVQASHTGSDEERASLLARERGEIKGLRAEARRLRSENASLATSLYAQEKEVRKWAWATAGVSTLSILFILTTLMMGGGAPEPAVSVESAPATAAVTPAAGTGEAPAADRVAGAPSAGVADDASVAAQAAGALAAVDALEDTHLEVIIDGGKAALVGQVLTAKQRQLAAKTLKGVGGITEVSTDRVEILARTRGTVHTVGAGETLGHIAARYYGSVTLSGRIAKANPGSRTLHIGDKLKIPPVD
jgi:nucleoid-associated protein YgaU